MGVRPGLAANCEEGRFLGPRACSSDQLSDHVNGGTYLGSTSPIKRGPSASPALSTSIPQVKKIQYTASVNRSGGCMSPSPLPRRMYESIAALPSRAENRIR